MTKVKNLLKKGNLISFDKFVGKARHGKLTVLIFVGIFIALIYLNLYSILLLWLINSFVLYFLWNYKDYRSIGRKRSIAISETDSLKRKMEELEKLLRECY